MLQCVAVCCSVLQCVTVALLCVAVCGSVLQLHFFSVFRAFKLADLLHGVNAAVCSSVMHCVVACCSVLQLWLLLVLQLWILCWSLELHHALLALICMCVCVCVCVCACVCVHVRV